MKNEINVTVVLIIWFEQLTGTRKSESNYIEETKFKNLIMTLLLFLFTFSQNAIS